MADKTLTLDAETRLEIASMVYNRWSLAFDNSKRVKASTWESTGKFCPRADWPNFHRAMLVSADKEMALCEKLKNAICPHSPLIAGE